MDGWDWDGVLTRIDRAAPAVLKTLPLVVATLVGCRVLRTTYLLSNEKEEIDVVDGQIGMKDRNRYRI